MAHYAKIVNNIVENVIVVPNDQEHRGLDFIKDDLGLDGDWVQTSYNARIRGKFAGIGDEYDAVNDIFLPALPYPSWVRDENNIPQPPVSLPQHDGTKQFQWDESIVNWVEVK